MQKSSREKNRMFEIEIWKSINDFKNNKTTGSDGLPSGILKMVLGGYKISFYGFIKLPNRKQLTFNRSKTWHHFTHSKKEKKMVIS